MNEMLSVGYIGLGDIGAPMAERIIGTGWPLAVWNRTSTKMQPLIEAGARAMSSPAALAAECDVIFTCLGGVSAMHDVLSGDKGILSAEHRRVKIIVDNSTVPPADAKAFSAKLANASIRFVDAPVSGGAIGARAGTLAAMVGGDTADITQVEPILKSFASKITHVGPVGSGQAMKACNQVLNFGTIAALAEAITLGRHYGLAPASVVEAVSGGFAESNISREYGRSLAADDISPIRIMVSTLEDFYNADIRREMAGQLGILMKDLSMALDMARDQGVPLPVISHFDSIFRMIHHLKT
ncbi:hypothetical protein HY29_03480 [Hyphomonas beringensis]|uniref:2-hydroxy-3-oxopropionate reductase n=1 Tax=Hyphomonas beringensis TaxID=1280946 RepID=A0A062TYZ5_9PROT|nr:NAD(P)-dependent oxidoreductase [Hyphomonas beringensis]KCZ53291.1 hypothetical protein HY29_03480 [Hyphomonas beringensis]